MQHFGDWNEETEEMVQEHLGSCYDEYLRPCFAPRERQKREDYDHENPHYFSAIFCCLLELIDKRQHLAYMYFYGSKILPNCEAAPGLYSRQPYGKNAYPTGHSSGKEWNHISKDEYVGIVYFANWDQKKDIIEWGKNHHWTFDDYKAQTNFRYWHPFHNQYVYIKSSQTYEPNWVQKLVFNQAIKYNKNSDSIIKDYVRGRTLNRDIVSPSSFVEAIRDYFEINPFEKMLRRLKT